ncbi:hypothetical protein [Leifsonia sp. Leaf264]|uniref:hypothetical protein n=1 Tax=Leifsonia sp. Leaf264 TaxID=1736314 RepID=UPI0006F4885D|nr:hypothetical protein [Leifsonia sp. Leaf264]KQO98650.1 hypothetical protein ASF30_11345 [Leifsonia sp. Leaf264]
MPSNTVTRLHPDGSWRLIANGQFTFAPGSRFEPAVEVKHVATLESWFASEDSGSPDEFLLTSLGLHHEPETQAELSAAASGLPAIADDISDTVFALGVDGVSSAVHNLLADAATLRFRIIDDVFTLTGAEDRDGTTIWRHNTTDTRTDRAVSTAVAEFAPFLRHGSNLRFGLAEHPDGSVTVPAAADDDDSYDHMDRQGLDGIRAKIARVAPLTTAVKRLAAVTAERGIREAALDCVPNVATVEVIHDSGRATIGTLRDHNSSALHPTGRFWDATEPFEHLLSHVSPDTITQYAATPDGTVRTWTGYILGT